MSNNQHNDKTTLFKKIGLLSGPVLCICILLFFKLDAKNPQVTYAAAIALLMAVWWITKPVPLAITSLLPVILFPLFGIMNGKAVSSLYFNDVIFLFIGGFIVALAMQKWELHKRIALVTLMIFGTKPKRILLGFMVATAFLSMWISNTATTMMMIPIVLSVIMNLEDILGEKKIRRYAIGLLLGIAYSSSIGGIATLVGTPPNLSFVRIFAISFPDAPEISFAQWFFFAVPISVFFLLILWLILCLFFCRIDFLLNKQMFKEQYKNLGKISFEERAVLLVFSSLAILWLTRASIQVGNITIPGWSQLFSTPSYINDGTVAIALALILFIIPAKKAPTIMNWSTATKLPWNIVLLFGGGFALASGFKVSGLSEWFGSQLAGFESFSPMLIIASICCMLTFLTELTSNTATSQMILPILAALSVAIGKNPLLLMIPATLASSFAFMMPIATPPNAIIFGTNKIRIIDMVKIGFILNIIGIIILTAGILIFGSMLDIDHTIMPEWAK